ncbi:alkaline phosphatase D family protein [Luteolibacter soli]|uniref:Alkaline phosphatase D family protein n=1 Tax=Luteolibacter soli TaxID=3135280 RepID=A0ABU9AWJ1_9BACT
MRLPLVIPACLVAVASGQAPIAPPWCGATTPNSVVVTVPLNQAGVTTRLAVSTTAGLASPVFSAPVISQAAAGNAVRLSVTGLAPDTAYFYAIELNGTLLPAQGGKFKTFPAPGAVSFRFAFASCGEWTNPQDAYEAARLEDPLFFLHMGDLHYEDTDVNNPAPYRQNYTSVLAESPEQSNLFRNVPTFYIWDDHDFSGNGSDRTNDGREAARQVYRERVPHFPLPAGGPNAAIYQSFDCGRLHFILSDLRSDRDPDSDSDNANKSMMGDVQKQWFKDQLIAARDAECPMIVWMCGLPFISSSSTGDNWGSYKTERTELLEFIRDQKIQNVIIVSGDMHALAYDDGRATATYVAGVRIPVFHAAALARDGSTKGGPYSGGTSAGDGRYGTMDISDTGGTVSATYTGRITSSPTSVSTWKTYTHTGEPVRPRKATNLTAQPANGVLLQWTDDSGVETGYRIERRLAGVGAWTSLALLGAGATTHADTTAQLGTSYDYRVVAVNATIEADPSIIATATGSNLTPYQSWKLQHLGDANAPDNADDDHDGNDTMAEYLFDLDPLKGDRFPWTATRASSGPVTITYPTSTGRIYQVEYSNNLIAWNNGPPAVTGDGTPKQWTDDGSLTGGLPAKRLYRVRVQTPP